MKLLWTIVRVIVAALAVGVLVVVPFWVSGPSGTSIDTNGAVFDTIAVIVLVVTLWSLWRDRARLA